MLLGKGEVLILYNQVVHLENRTYTHARSLGWGGGGGGGGEECDYDL